MSSYPDPDNYNEIFDWRTPTDPFDEEAQYVPFGLSTREMQDPCDAYHEQLDFEE